MDIPVPEFDEDVDLSQGVAETDQPVEDRFDPSIELAVHGLMFMGKLTREFDLWGHPVVIKTLTSGEELAIAQVTREYEGTLGQGKALAIATVAACVDTVDYQPLVGQLGPNIVTGVRQKFEYVRDNWYWPTVEAVYNQYAELQVSQAMAYQELESKSNASLLMPQPFVDSQSDRASSEAI